MATNTFKSVRDKLMHIQKEEKEPSLFPSLKQLFIAKGYANVEIIHGPNEFGKDIVFSNLDDKLFSEEWFAVVVKNKDTGQEDFEDAGEISRQIKLAFQYPYIDSTGNEHYINKVIVAINGKVSNNARTVLNKVLNPHQRTNVIIWNYQNIETEIERDIKEVFLSGETGSPDEFVVNLFKTNMASKLSCLDNAQDLFAGFSINDINDIFVNVRTANKKYEQEKNLYQDQNKHKPVDEVDDSISIINSNKNTIIRGIPTSGKSILLKRIGVNALQKYSNIGVFWFRFRDIDVNSFDLWGEVQKQFANLTNNSKFERKYFDRIFFLFDALDELKTDEDRAIIISAIHSSLENHERCYSIITGRSIDFFDQCAVFSNYEIIDLLPFDISQAFKLVKKIIPDNKDKNNQFIAAIKNQQLSNSLTRTPMALTLMAIMYKDNSIDLTELPANITELYSKFSDYYLDKWDATKGLSSQYKYEEVKNIMGFISNYMHENNLYEICTADLVNFLNQLRGKHSFEELDDIDRYVNQLKSRNTLLCYDSTRDVFYFIGISFQEYFASVYYDDSNEQVLLERLYNDWWQNVIIFYNGKNPKRIVFIEKIIENVIPENGAAMFNHMQILSKSLQAAHLVPIETVKRGIHNIINTFDRFYKGLLSVTNLGTIAYSWTTLDMILQCRNLFEQLFASRHIKTHEFSDVAKEILNNQSTTGYSDVTLYCICYHLAQVTNDASYFDIFLKTPLLNTRWDRIIYKDVDFLRVKNAFPIKTYQRIKRKQKHNKLYIDRQFKEAAILHLSDGIKLVE